MAEVNLIICMAGYNTRFHDVGFDIPKYLLPWNDTTIIHDILQNLGEVQQTVLIANKRDVYFKDQLLETIKPLGLNENDILYIGDTKGQAHTAELVSVNCIIQKCQHSFTMQTLSLKVAP